jgi:hypothetical protein
MAKPGDGQGSKDDVEPIYEFDETNGLAPGLDGDDGGAITPDDEDDGAIALRNVGRRILGEPEDDEEESGETPYSEEGTP